MTHRIRRFLPLLWCLLFALSQLGCAGPLIQSGPYFGFLPSRAHVEADKVSLAIPADLRAKLHDIATQSCKTAQTERPNPLYVAQTYRDHGQELQLKLLAAVLGWAMEPPPELRVARPPLIQMKPLPPVEWQPAVPVPAAEAPPLIEDPRVQFGAGAVAGGAIGAVPFGPLGAEIGIELRLLPDGTYWARVGKACGEVIVGTGQMILGGAGMSAGAGMCSTGGGAPAGVLVVSGSYAIAANGCLTTGHGLAELHQLWREGDVSSASPAPPPQQLVLKKAPKQPTQAPVAGAAPGAKQASSPTVAPQTTTRTVYKDSSGKPIKTVTKTGQTTTTTWDKGKPSATGTEAALVAKGAKRGPKTDPDAPHNATVAREARKLEAEGYEIVAGGRKRPEKLIETKGGTKSGRRPDVIGKKPGVPDRRINVGRTKADGRPIKREHEALDDLNKHSDPPTEFVPYDR